MELEPIEYAKDRLAEWAHWNRNISGVRLGFLPHAPFAVAGYGAPDLGDGGNDRAEEVERVMCRLRQGRPMLYQALVHWYLMQQQVRVAAESCRCSPTVFMDRRKLGEMFVAGALLGHDYA